MTFRYHVYGETVINTFGQIDDHFTEDGCETVTDENGKLLGTILISFLDRKGRLYPEAQMFLDSVDNILFTAGLLSVIFYMAVCIFVSHTITKLIIELNNQASLIKYLKKDIIQNRSSIKEVRELYSNINFLLDIFKKEEIWRQNLIDDLAHELRSPLTIVSMQLEAISDGVIVCDDQAINNISREVQRLTILVVGIQEISCAEGFKFELDYGCHDICLIVKNVVNSFMAACKEKHISLQLNYPFKPCPVICDIDKITQTVFNILSNALKYSYDYSSITVNVTCDSSNINISIEDQGIGIPEDCILHIFERFYRVDSSRTVKTDGSGLGLSTAPCKFVTR